jgi:hypothetical protein
VVAASLFLIAHFPAAALMQSNVVCEKSLYNPNLIEN